MTRPAWMDSSLFHTQPAEPVRPDWLYGDTGQLDQQAEPEQTDPAEDED